MKVIIWNEDGDMDHNGDCAPSADGYDYTLCGKTLDSDKRTAGTFKTKKGFVTCAQCLQIIKYCKSIKINYLS